VRKTFKLQGFNEIREEDEPISPCFQKEKLPGGLA
jgi:hypothetical protein